MQFLRRSVGSTRRRTPPQNPQSCHSSIEQSIEWVRDRALDHAVEKENYLKPLVYTKDLINSDPSKSLPISAIADRKESLCIPFRPMDFVRKYPSVFEEFLPGGVGIHPHIRLTPQVRELDAEEQLMYQSDTYLKQAADRLLRLLMLGRIYQVPLSIVDELRWDLGLPRDYLDSLVPHFPDYFRVKKAKKSSSRSGGDVLELVCWIDDLAVSVMEKKAMKAGPIGYGSSGYEKGMPIEFPVQYSRGFKMDKEVKKWISDWQKLPYISPYENARHLPSTSDESDRWAVAVMHELLHILVPKKTEKNNVLLIGEFMGITSSLKRALLRHAGIFYVSRKNMTRTVVLREAYKRDKLLEKHSMMNMRCRYAHLMKTMKEKHEANEKLGVSKKGENGKASESEGEAEADYTGDEEAETDYTRDEEAEANYTSDEEADSDDEEDGYEESQAVAHRGVAVGRGKTERGLRGASLKGAGLSVTLSQAKSDERYIRRTMDRAPFKDHRKSDEHAEQNFRSRSSIRSDFSRTREQSSSRRSDLTRSGGESSARRSDFPRSKGHSSSRRSDFPRSGGQSSSRRSDLPRSGGWSSSRRSDFPRNGGRSSPNRRTFTE